MPSKRGVDRLQLLIVTTLGMQPMLLFSACHCTPHVPGFNQMHACKWMP
jgi:hypothetical protein